MNTRHMVSFLMLCVVTAIFGLLSACGGGGGGGGTTTVNGNTVIPDTTKILDGSTSTKIASIAPDQSTVTFTGTTSQIDNLKSGDVLVLGVTPSSPEGMLKKVTGVQKKSDGTVTLQTGSATLEDAVQKASVSYSKTFTDSDVVSEVTMAKGVSKVAPLSMSIGTISLQLKDVVIYDRDNNLQTTGDQITVNGNISFKPKVDMNIEIDSYTLKKFIFSVTGEESSELTIKAEVPAPALDQKKLLKTYNLGTQTFLIGYVPVVVSYELGIYVGVKGNISIGLSANANQKLTYTGGVKYENNNWSPINTQSAEFGFLLPTIDAAAEAKCYVGPELSTKLYGVAGPFINIYGYLLLQSNPQSTPWWELFAGFEGKVGAKIEILSGKITARYDANIFEVKKSLAQAQTPTTYSIAGRVTNNSNGISGVTVSTNGGSGSTDVNGNYTISGLTNGNYTITPTLTGYAFTPASLVATVNGAAVINQNFSANLVQSTYTLSGTIHSGSNSGPALSGATVSIAGKTATTISTGAYSITGIPSGTYSLSVSKAGYDTYSNAAYYIGSDQKDINFYLTLPIVFSAPTITYPASDAVLTNFPRTAYLTWSSITGATSYDVEVACDICVSSTTLYLSPTTYTSYYNYYTTPALAGDNNFRFRVRAINNSTPGTWSNYSYFSYNTAPATRFIDKGNGTIYDTVSNLTWLKNANCFGSRNWDSAYSFANYLASGQCGLSDGTVAGQWHMPSYDEYWTLIGAGYNSTTLNIMGFSNVKSNPYWSSDGPGINGYAYAVNMGDGYTSEYGVTMYASLSVWAVR